MQVGRYDDRERGRAGRAAAQEGREVQPLDFALAAALGRAPRAQLSEVRRSRLRMARADAAPGGAGAGRRLAAPVSPRVLPRPRGRRRCASAGTLYWLVETMTTFGELAAAAGGRRRGSARRLPVALSRGLRRPRRRGSYAVLRTDRAAARAARLGGERARTAVRLGRLSLGAPRLQPGDLAADRAAGERGRRLRALGAACAVGIGGGAGDRRSGSAANCAALDSRLRARFCSSCARHSGAASRLAASRADVGGRAGARGRAAGQRRAGAEMGSRAASTRSPSATSR